MTPSCSTNGQVEIIFRSEGG